MKWLKRRHLSLALIIIFMCLFLTGGSPIMNINENSSTTFFISNTGNDNNIGTIDSPFLSLEGARDAIRKLKGKKQLKKGKIIVYVRGGTYYRDKSFKLNSIDSGTIDSPIIYEAYQNEKVFITGGQTLDNNKFTKVVDKSILDRIIDKNARSKIYQYDLKASNIDCSSVNQSIMEAPDLLFNNNPLTLSRWPNESYVLTGKIVNNESSKYIFNFKEDRPLLWSKAEDAWLFGYWAYNWADSTVKMDSVDTINKKLSFSEDILYGIKENQRYYAFNLLEELDKPGEWYIDRINKILYVYPPSSISNANICLSQLKDPFIEMNETSYLKIEGITFEAGRNTAIDIENGQNIVISGCTIRNVSEKAVNISGGTFNGVQSCTIYNTGKGGIYIDSGDRDTLTSAYNYADNNNIYNYSRLKRTYSAAIDLNGVGNRASHNSIHNAPHTAILFTGNNHVMEYNEIYSIATETGDVGAIYSWSDWTFRGNLIRYNYIHDIESNDENWERSGVYLDDCMSSAEVIGNIFYNVDIAFMIGGGRDHFISNNLITNCRESIIFDDRGITWLNLDQLNYNLTQVPYKSNIWKKSYPKLYEMGSDSNHGVPSGNNVTKNALYMTSQPSIAPSVGKYGIVSGNNNLSDSDYSKLWSYISSKESSGAKMPLKNFKIVPLYKIGIYTNKDR